MNKYEPQLEKSQRKWGCIQCYYGSGKYGYPMCTYPMRIEINYVLDECKMFRKKK